MNDLTKLSNEQLGDFIQISLIHGTNTQFSYELLHEVASRLKHTDEIIKAGINYALESQAIGINEPATFKSKLEDVVQTLDDALAPAIIEDNKETVEILTDITSYEAMDKAVKEAFEVDLVEEAPGKKEPKKKEKPTVKESLTVEPTVQEEVQEAPATPSITGDDLKAKALEMRQKNTVSAADIKGKLSDLGATTILTLDTSNYDEFNAFLESFNG